MGSIGFSISALLVADQGVSVTITRSYDSFNGAQGDFGKAWQLSIGAGHLTKSGVLGSGWQGTSEANGAQNCIRNTGTQKHWVSIDVGGGRQLNFEAPVHIASASSRSSCQP